MGKHDKRDAVIAHSSEEFLKNRIARLEKENSELKNRLAFNQETITKLQEQCSRMSKWASEIEANGEDRISELEAENAKLRGKISELEAENAKLRGKIVKLVESYV